MAGEPGGNPEAILIDLGLDVTALQTGLAQVKGAMKGVATVISEHMIGLSTVVANSMAQMNASILNMANVSGKAMADGLNVDKPKKKLRSLLNELKQFERLAKVEGISAADIIKTEGFTKFLAEAMISGVKLGASGIKTLSGIFNPLKDDLILALQSAAQTATPVLKRKLEVLAHSLKGFQVDKKYVKPADLTNLQNLKNIADGLNEADRERVSILKEQKRAQQELARQERRASANQIRANKESARLLKQATTEETKNRKESARLLKQEEADEFKFFKLEEQKAVLIRQQLELRRKQISLDTRSPSSLGGTVPSGTEQGAALAIQKRIGGLSTRSELEGERQSIASATRIFNVRKDLLAQHSKNITIATNKEMADILAANQMIDSSIRYGNQRQLAGVQAMVAEQTRATKERVEADTAEASRIASNNRLRQAAIKAIVADYKNRLNLIIATVDAEEILASRTKSAAAQSRAAWITVVNAQQRSANVLEAIWWRVGQLSGQMRMFSVISLGALTGLVAASTNLAEQMHELSEQTGMSLVESQRFIGVLRHFGASSEEAQRSIRKLAMEVETAKEKAGPSRDRFIQLGITLEELQATGGNMLNVFHLVGDGLMKVGDASKRTALAGDLMGRSSSASITTLLAGSKKYKEVSEDIAVVTAEQGEAVVKLGRYIENLKTRFLALAADLTIAMLPTIQLVSGAFEKFAKFLQALPDSVKNTIGVFTLISGLILGIGSIALPTTIAIMTVVKAVGTVVAAVKAAALASTLATATAGVAMVATSTTTTNAISTNAARAGLAVAAAATGSSMAFNAMMLGTGTVAVKQMGFWASLGVMISDVATGLKKFVPILTTVSGTTATLAGVMSGIKSTASFLWGIITKIFGTLLKIGRFFVASLLIATFAAAAVGLKVYADQVEDTRKKEEDLAEAQEDLYRGFLRNKDMIGKINMELAAMGKTAKDVTDLILGLHEERRRIRALPASAENLDLLDKIDREVRGLRTIRSGLSEAVVNKKTSDEVNKIIGDQIKTLELRAKRGEEISEDEIEAAHKAALSAISESEYAKEEQIRIERELALKIETLRSMTQGSSRARMLADLAEARTAFSERVKMGKIANVEEIKEFAKTQRDMIASRNSGIVAQQLALANFNSWVVAQTRLVNKQQLDAELKFNKERLILDLATGRVRPGQQIEAYKHTQEVLIRNQNITDIQKLAAVAHLNNEIATITERANRGLIQGNLDTAKRLVEIRKQAMEDIKVKKDTDVEVARSKTLLAIAEQEAILATDLEAKKLSFGEAERKLFELKQQKNAAEMSFIKQTAEAEAQKYVDLTKLEIINVAEFTKRSAASAESYARINRDSRSTLESRRQAYDAMIADNTELLESKRRLSQYTIEADKAEVESKVKASAMRIQMDKEVLEQRRNSLNAFNREMLSFSKFDRALNQDVIDKATESAEIQIEQFGMIGKAAMEKAEVIQDVAKKEEAVHRVMTQTLKAEADLRQDILRTMRDAYQAEFGQIFDFMKEMGELSSETLGTLRDAIEQDIVALLQQKGAAAITDKEFQGLLATYKKVQGELSGGGKGEAKGDALEFGRITDDKGNVIRAGGFMGGIEQPAAEKSAGLLDRLKGKFDLSKIQTEMENTVKEFTGVNGLVMSSDRLKLTFERMREIMDRLNMSLERAVSGIRGLDGTPAQQREGSRLHGATEQPNIRMVRGQFDNLNDAANKLSHAASAMLENPRVRIDTRINVGGKDGGVAGPNLSAKAMEIHRALVLDGMALNIGRSLDLLPFRPLG